MGMYDTVMVDLEYLKGEFQTKDLDCNLDLYFVNENGIHIKRNGKFYPIPWISGDIEIYKWVDKSKELVYHNLSFCEGRLV